MNNKYLILHVVLIYLSTTEAANLPDGSTSTNIQGPSSQTKIMGPDGSVIMAENPGGQIVHNESPGFLEPAGRFLGPVAPLLNPDVHGEAAHKALDAALVGHADAVATGAYVAGASHDSTRTVIGT